jgi:hypothetical protein
MVGKLSDNVKFTFRRASSNGCPEALNSTDIVGNRVDIKISNVNIYCCNKHLCNQANIQGNNHWYFLLLTTIAIYFFQ